MGAPVPLPPTVNEFSHCVPVLALNLGNKLADYLITPKRKTVVDVKVSPGLSRVEGNVD